MSQYYPWMKLIELTGGFPRLVGKERKVVYSDVDVVDWIDTADNKKEAIMSINHVRQSGIPIILGRDYGVAVCDPDKAKDWSKTAFWVCAIWDGDLYHVVLKDTDVLIVSEGDEARGNYVPMPGVHNIRTRMENRLLISLSEVGL